MSDVCGLPLPSRGQYCAMAKRHPHADVAHLCALAREEIKEAPKSRVCPRTGESVCRCGEPYNCSNNSDDKKNNVRG